MSGLPIPETQAALSPKLLEILQYRESAHKRTLSDKTPRPHAIDGITQRLGAPDQVRQGPSPKNHPPVSALLTPLKDELWDPTESTFQDQPNSNRSPRLTDGTWNPSESKTTIPEILVHTDDTVPSNGSSFTIVDGSEYHRPLADSGINRDSGEARPRRQGQPPGGPQYLARACDRDPLTVSLLMSCGDSAIPDLRPSERAPSRSSSLKRKREHAILTMLTVFLQLT